MNAKLSILALASVASLAACGGSGNTPAAATPISTAFDPAKVTFSAIETPITSKPVTTYEFESQSSAGNSSVSYTGQITRHLLIDDMLTDIKALTAKNAAATVTDDMNVYMDDPSSAIDTTAIQFMGSDASGPKSGAKGSGLSGAAATPTAVTNYGDVSTGKKLRSKMAGEDKAEHLIGGKLLGWSEGMDDTPTPSELVDYFIQLLNDEVTGSTQATVTTTGGEVDVDAAFVDGKGRDFSQLIQKFLLGAVAFSQGTADYLKTDFASNNAQASGKNYSTSEHKWDEGYGYFGSAVNYDSYTDEEISSKKSKNDVDNDTATINLTSEYNFAASVNCAKRDKGSQSGTNYTKQVFDAFVTGRKTLNDVSNGGVLTTTQSTELGQAAKQAAQVWEQCIAATVVHYINDTNADLQSFIDGQGKFNGVSAYRDLAKHWSEMKGFALSLQFNPESPFHQSADTLKVYEAILAAMGDEAIFTDVAAATAYQAKLTEARGWMQNAYGFNADDVANW